MKEIKEEMILKLYDKFKEDLFEMSDEEKEIVNELDIKVNQFLNGLDNNKLSLIDDIIILNSNKKDIIIKRTFQFAFKLGLNLAVESMSDDKNKISD